MFSRREILIWSVGGVVAIALACGGALWSVNYLTRHDPSDPLVKQGGLSPAQKRR